jgi:hypothetical protein
MLLRIMLCPDKKGSLLSISGIAARGMPSSAHVRRCCLCCMPALPGAPHASGAVASSRWLFCHRNPQLACSHAKL